MRDVPCRSKHLLHPILRDEQHRNRVEQRWSDQTDYPNFQMIAKLLQNPHAHATLDPRADRAELFTRREIGDGSADRNGRGDDLSENTAILGSRAEARVSPLYDPAPMRGYFDKQMVSCVSFGGIAFQVNTVPAEIGEATLKLGREMGLSTKRVVSIVKACVNATDDYADAVAKRVPEDLASKLNGRVEVRAYANSSGPFLRRTRQRASEKLADDDEDDAYNSAYLTAVRSVIGATDSTVMMASAPAIMPRIPVARWRRHRMAQPSQLYPRMTARDRLNTTSAAPVRARRDSSRIGMVRSAPLGRGASRGICARCRLPRRN